jgi:hypothetical protein
VLIGITGFQILQNTNSFLILIFDEEELTKPDWGKCIALGSTSLLVAALLKALPSA